MRSPVSRRSSTRSRRRSTRPSWTSVSWSSASPPPNRRRSPWTKESKPTRPSSSNNRLSLPSWRLRRLRSPTLSTRLAMSRPPPKKPPTLSRDKPSTLHDPGPDLATCKEGLETGGGTIFSSELSLVSIEFLDFGGRIQEKKTKHLQIFFPLIATLFFFL